MTDEEFIKILLEAVLPQYDADPFFKSMENIKAENAVLKAENAALRERLEKAVELPCKVGDVELENAIESGELCDREEASKEVSNNVKTEIQQ